MMTRVRIETWILAGFVIVAMASVLSACCCGDGMGDGLNVLEGSSGGGLAQIVPADVQGAVFAKDWKSLSAGVGVIDKKLGKTLPLDDAFGDIEKSMGFDLRQAAELKKRGVATDEGAGFVVVDTHVLFMVPIADNKAFEKYVIKRGKKDMGTAKKIKSKEVGGKTIKMLLKKGEKKASKKNVKIAWVMIDDTAVIFVADGPNQGADGVELLSDIAKVDKKDSLAELEDFQTVSKELGGDFAVTAFANVPVLLRTEAKNDQGQARIYKTMAKQLGWSGTGLDVDQTEVKARSTIVASKKSLSDVKKLLSAPGDFDKLSKTVKGKPVAVVKIALDTKHVVKIIQGNLDADAKAEMKKEMKGFKKNAGIDIQKDLLANLDGNGMLVIYDARPRDIGEMDVKNLFTKGETTFAVGVTNRKKLIKALDKLVKQAGDGDKIHSKKSGQLKTYEADGIKLVIGSDVAIVAGPQVEMDDAKKMAKGSGKGLSGVFSDGIAGDLLSGNTGTGAVVDIKQVKKLMGDKLGKKGKDALKSFSAWALNIKPSDKGAAVDLSLKFAK